MIDTTWYIQLLGVNSLLSWGGFIVLIWFKTTESVEDEAVVAAVALTQDRCGILCELINCKIWGHFVSFCKILWFLKTSVHPACCQYLLSVYKMMRMITNAWFFFSNYVFIRVCKYFEMIFCRKRRRGRVTWHTKCQKPVSVRVLMIGSRRGVSDMHIYRMYIYMTRLCSDKPMFLTCF